MDNAAEVLQNAMDNLKEKEPEFIEADKKALQSVIAQAEKKAEKDYTSESWKAFAEALAKAQEVNEDVKASQEVVDTAAKVLQEAIEELQKKPAKVPEEESGTTKPDGSTNINPDSNTNVKPDKNQPVKTGDAQMPFAFVLAMMASAAGVFVIKRRRKEDE